MAPLRKRKSEVEAVPSISDNDPMTPGINTEQPHDGSRKALGPKTLSSGSTDFMPIPKSSAQAVGSNSSTLRQMEAIIYDHTQREQNLAEKMHRLKISFFQAMKNDDEFVSRGV